MAITPTQEWLSLSDLKTCSRVIAEGLVRQTTFTTDAILNTCLAKAEARLQVAGTFSSTTSNQATHLALAVLELATGHYVAQMPDNAAAEFLPILQETTAGHGVTFRDGLSRAEQFADAIIAAHLDADSAGIYVSGVDVFDETVRSPELTGVRVLVAPYPFELPGMTQTRALDATDFQQIIS